MLLHLIAGTINIGPSKTFSKKFVISSDGLILKGTNIFIHEKLRKRVIDLAHESHQGIGKTTALLKEKVWFPRLDSMVKETISTCIPCLATGRDVPYVPLKVTRMPCGPWETLHVDFKGHLPGGKYLLVIVDRYSRYPVIELLPSTNMSAHLKLGFFRAFLRICDELPPMIICFSISSFTFSPNSQLAAAVRNGI